MSATLIRISLAVLTLYGIFGSSNAFAANAPDFNLEGQKKSDQFSGLPWTDCLSGLLGILVPTLS